MARRRAISTTPSGWIASPTATTRCTSTSPTSATTCAPDRPSIWRRNCAAPASTSRIAPGPRRPPAPPPRPPGSPSDREPQLRGTSVYFPDRAVPMLPYELSTDLCSLVPHADRLVLSALMEIDHHGEIVGQEFTAGVIRSAERMTYTNVHLLLEGDTAMRQRNQPLVERFELMQELALVLNKKRVRRGSIDFDLPEPLIEFDELGAMTGVTRAPRNIANRIIEEFMLAANESVAGHLEHAGIAS